jgi:cell division protein FtsB
MLDKCGMKFLNSKIFTATAVLVALWLALSSVNLSSQKRIVNREVKGVEAKIKEVQDDTNYFNKFLDYFKTPAFLEREARLKLNYKAQGEEVVFIYKDKDVKNGPDAVSLEELIARKPNYKKWFLYLLGY